MRLVSLGGSGYTAGAITSDATSLYVAVCSSCFSTTAAGQIDELPLGGTTVTAIATDSAINAKALVSLGGYLYASIGTSELRSYPKAGGAFRTIAGSSTEGYMDGTGADAAFAGVEGLATDGGVLYVADPANNNRLRKVSAGGALPAALEPSATHTLRIDVGDVTTFAGSGAATDAAGVGTAAGFNAPRSVTVDGGAAYVGTNDAIMKVDLATGAASVFSGQPGAAQCSTASGVDNVSGAASKHENVTSLTSDGYYLYSVECDNVRRTSLTTGASSTIYINPYSTIPLRGLTYGGDGYLYFTQFNYVYRLDPVSETASRFATISGFRASPVSIVSDGTRLFVGVTVSSNPSFQILAIALSTGAVSTLVQGDTGIGNAALAIAGDYLYGSFGGQIIRYDTTTGGAQAVAGDNPGGYVGTGYVDAVGAAARFDYIAQIATSGSALYVADQRNNRLRAIFAAKDPASTGGPTYPGESTGGGPLSELPTQCSCNDPVDTLTGALTETATDLSVPGRGPAISWGRSYDSRQGATGGTLGYGWTSRYSVSLSVDPWHGGGALASSPVVDVVQENGSRLPFTRQPDGSYSAPSRVLATLRHNPDGTWAFVRRHTETFAFNATGQLIYETDPNGYTNSLSYNGSNQLTTVTDPAGRQFSFAYLNGRITVVTDSAGRQVAYGYDTGGNLTTVTDPAGNTTTYGYDSTHRLTSVTDPRGRATTNSYDAASRVIVQTDRAGRQTTFSYGPPTGEGSDTVTITDPRGTAATYTYQDGELTSVVRGLGTSVQATTSYSYDPTTNGITRLTDPLGHVTSYSYDAAGNRTASTDPLGHSTTVTYDSLENPLTITDATGVTTTNSYDSAGNLLSTSTPLTATTQTQMTTYHYGDPAHPGDVTAVTDPRGKTTQFSYDADGQRTSIVDPAGDTTTGSYTCTPAGPGCRSNVGWLYASVSPRGNTTGSDATQYTTRYTRDDDGRVLTITDPLGRTTTTSYDPNGNPATVTDAGNHVTSYTYDNDDERTVVTRPDTTTVLTGYDADGNVSTKTDGAGNVTSYSYDPLDRVASVTSPPTAGNSSGISTRYSYDAAGRLASAVNASSQTTSYGYDADNRRTAITYSDPNTPDVGYGYDADNRRTSMTDGTGTTTTTYDSLGRITDVTDGAGHHMHYDHDLTGNATAITYPNSNTVIRGFDDAGRLHTVTDWNSHTTTFDYNPDSELTMTSFPSGVTETTTVDRADQTSGISDAGLTADTVSNSTTVSFDYGRNADGLLASTTATGIAGQSSDSYGYSPLDQLTTYTASPGLSGAYGYDAADNPTSLADGTAQTFDAADELHTATLAGATTTFSDNPWGDRTSATTSAGTTHFGYDQADRLTSYTSPDGGTTASYRYNGDGLRTTKAVNGTPTDYSWDTATAGPPLLVSDGTTSYLYGPAGLPIEQVTPSPGITKIDARSALDSVGTASSLTVTFGVAAQDNDQILVAVNSVTGDDPTTPTGYALVGSYPTPNAGETTTVYRRTATGGEIAATVSFTGALSHSKTVLAAIYRGVDPVHPVETTSTAATATLTATSLTVPGVTTSTDGGYLVLIASAANNVFTGTWAPPTGMTDQVHDGAATVGSLLADQPFPSHGATGDRTATFSQPAQLDGVLLVLQEAPDTYYLQHDQQDSVRLVTDSNGRIAGTYSYDPYGRTTSHTGPLTTPLRYDGQYRDSETGLYYLRARYYDPATAQFLTRDPLEDETGQPYAYADDDPLDGSDPSGLCNANPFSGSFWSSGNCLSDNTPSWVPIAGQVKSFAACSGAGGTSVYDCGVMNLDPAYYAVEGYANEWQDAENGCSGWQVFKDGTEAVSGVAGTAGVAVGGVGAIDSAGYFNGREISVGDDFRVSPFGNRDATNPFARRPHYHRTITGPDGNTVPGGSGRWHRPWEQGW